jgi:hypothetical protein
MATLAGGLNQLREKAMPGNHGGGNDGDDKPNANKENSKG